MIKEIYPNPGKTLDRFFNPVLLFDIDDDDIGTFLSDEIAAEKGNFKRPEIPPGGFEVKTDGAEVTFTKSSGKEK